MQLEVGQTVTATRVFSQEDFNRFATLSGDDNPIHLDPVFSAETRFGRPVAHGMLLYSIICQALSARLPGPGVVQLEQTLMFPAPTFTDEPVTIRLEVLDGQPEQGTALISTNVSRDDGQLAVEGQTLVSMNVQALGKGQGTATEDHASEAVSFRGLHFGQKATMERAFSTGDLAEYADLTGDSNPLFGDAGYARRAGLVGPMIPGGLLGGLFSSLLGTVLPGRGTNWLKQRLVFLRPAYPGEVLAAEVEIVRLRPEKELVNLATRCRQERGDLVCAGEALVLVKDLEKAAQAEKDA